MRKQTSSIGAKFSRILCLLALALSVFASPAFASPSDASQMAAPGHAMASHDMPHARHMGVSASQSADMCGTEMGIACDLSNPHEHMGGACCAGHCMDGLLAFNTTVKPTSEMRAFLAALISVLPSGEWVNPHRPPNS